MRLPFRSARVSTFVHATEDEAKALGILKSLIPEGAEIKRTRVKGHHGNPILVLSADIRRRSDLREFWRGVMDGLRVGKRQKLLRVMAERLAEDCCLYLRFDKQLACNGELVLTDSGDSLHVRLKVAAYPARREVALKLMGVLLQGPQEQSEEDSEWA